MMFYSSLPKFLANFAVVTFSKLIMKRLFTILLSIITYAISIHAQINTDQVLQIGRNALYFEDYVLSIQYFNQVIAAKPYLAQPYFFRALAKYNLDDFKGAEEDASIAIEHNPFITDAYELRGVARQNLGRNEDAIKDYDKALSMLPENRGLLYNKAMAQADIKDYDGAKESFSTLLKSHPNFDGGYIGRARLLLSASDTTAALADINKALELNKNAVNGYLMRADIAIHQSKDYAQALADMDEAIKLQPHFAGYFINRAFLRYSLDDYFGAMSDYDYAINLDPLNPTAIYNRALLKTEVHDYNKAIDDFNEVLKLSPNDYKALYNHAVVYRQLNDYKNALKDVNRLINTFPDLAAAYFLRYDIKQAMGDRSASADYNKSLALAKQRVYTGDDNSNAIDLFGKPSGNTTSTDSISEAQEVVSARFSKLLTVENRIDTNKEYNNKNIRGKVQDNNVTVDVEPMFTLTYYTSPSELKPTGDYLREMDELNRTKALRFLLQLTNHEVALTDPDEIDRHFNSIEYYNSYLSTHTPRAIDYFGRAMDQMSVHNYDAAITDFSSAINAAGDFTLAYFMRAIAKYKQATSNIENESQRGQTLNAQNKLIKLRGVIDDIDHVLKLSPNMAIAHYNKGVIMVYLQDLTSALASFNRAIELKNDFGEAYYNRGYVYFKLGNRLAGSADLSKSGELGIVPSYNLLKRMNR